MANQDATTHTARVGFAISGNEERPTIECGERFQLAKEENRFGAGRRMVDIRTMSGKLIGYVTTGQAELIRRGDC